MIYDYLIIGAGPAGCTAAKVLAGQGFRCLLLEKKEVYREKICGGAVPYKCVKLLEELGYTPRELIARGAVPIKGYCNEKEGQKKYYTYPQGQYGIGTTRKILDEYLLEEALKSGVKIQRGVKVRCLEAAEGIFRVEGWKGRNVILAAGARGMFQGGMPEIYGRQSFGITMQLRGNPVNLENRFYFCYLEETPNYCWMFPIGEQLYNAGVWWEHPHAGMKREFEAAMERFVKPHFTEYTEVIPARGAFLGNVSLERAVSAVLKGDDNGAAGSHIFVTGDMAGTTDPKSGEGIYYAIRHGAELARQLVKGAEGKNEISDEKK